MLQPLRQTPAHAPRPRLNDDQVLARAIDGRLAEVQAWLLSVGLAARADHDGYVAFAVKKALQDDVEPFRAAVFLAEKQGWPADLELGRILERLVYDLPDALRYQTRLWVVENGLRLPCKDSDAIEWLSPSGDPRSGKVIACDNALATALCEVAADGGEMGGLHVRVLMESIYANRTQQRWGQETPVLGQHYDDAPALGATLRAKDYIPSGSFPGVNLNTFVAAERADEDMDGPRIA